MPISYEDAIQQTTQLLEGFNGTFAELVEEISIISRQLSATPVNSGTAIFYSGVQRAAAEYSNINSSVNVLDDTDVGRYLNSAEVRTELEERAFAEGLFDPDARDGDGAFTDEAWAGKVCYVNFI